MSLSIFREDAFFNSESDSDDDVYADNNNNEPTMIATTTTSVEDAFYQYERRMIPTVNIDDAMSFSESNDAHLLLSLSTLAIDIDLDTFSALRDGVQWGPQFRVDVDMEQRRRAIIDRVIGEYSVIRQPSSDAAAFDVDYPEEEEDASFMQTRRNQIIASAVEDVRRTLFEQEYNAVLMNDPVAAADALIWLEDAEDLRMQYMREEFHARAAEEKYNTRVASHEGEEDVCCVCLENFPNVVFQGCHKSLLSKGGGGICCFPCARTILERGMKCPHCRAVITGFHVTMD